MAKITAWLVTVIGIIWILPLIGVTALAGVVSDWIIGLAFLVIGITKLMRNYKKRGR